MVGRAPENARGREAGPVGRNDRGGLQTLEGGPDAQDPLRDGDVVPGGRASQPGVLGLAVGGGVAPSDHLGVDVGLAAVHLADGLPRRRVDAEVVVVCLVAVSNYGFGDHDPRVGMTENARVLFVARRVRRDFAQVQVILRIGGLLEDDTMWRRQALLHGRQRLFRLSITETDAGQDAEALRFDKDLPFVTFM